MTRRRRRSTPRILLRLAALLLYIAAPTIESRAQLTREQAQALMNRPAIKAAFAFVDKNRAATLNEWSAITEINAPSGTAACSRAPEALRDSNAPANRHPFGAV